jgi:hypothetical protein
MYNRLYSRALEQFEVNKDYIMVERLSRIGADAFDQAAEDIDDKSRIYRKVYYDRGSQPPQIQRAPGISADLFPMMQTLEKDMADIAGLHDVSQGLAQAGTPAESVRLLQRADNTQHSYIRADIEKSIQRIKEWEISLVAQFAVTPFIGSVDDQVNPQNNLKQGLITFDAIREGGQFRVVYIPGSSMQDSPDQKLQKIVMLRQMGLFGDPTDPETNALTVKMLQLPETTDILGVLAMQQQKQAQMQQQMMQMQQQQMAAQSQPKQAPFNPEAEQMKTQLDLEKQQQLFQMKHQAEMEKMQADAQFRTEDYATKQIADIAKDAFTTSGNSKGATPARKVQKQ